MPLLDDDDDWQALDPWSWLWNASELRVAAAAVDLCNKQPKMLPEPYRLDSGFSMFGAQRVLGMLCGLSLELIYKAIIVADGRDPEKFGHKLSDLAKDAGVTVTSKQDLLLSILSHSIEWSGRYPRPRRKQIKQRIIALDALARKHLQAEKTEAAAAGRPPPDGGVAPRWEAFDELWTVAHARLVQMIGNAEYLDEDPCHCGELDLEGHAYRRDLEKWVLHRRDACPPRTRPKSATDEEWAEVERRRGTAK